jgi:hypothetical protein
MLKSMFVISAALVLGLPSARADIWGDIGHAVETGVSGLGKAASDVVTLGEEGRRRDREAADQAKKRAEDQKRAAEQLRAERIQNLKNKNAQLAEMKIVLAGYNNTLLTLKTRFGSSMQMIQQLVSIISQRSLDDQAVKAIIEIQRKDITDWVAALDRQFQDSANRNEEGVMKITTSLKEKVIQYFDQITNLPSGAEQSADATLDGILDIGFETLQTIDQVTASIEKRISEADAQIQENEQQIQTL